MKKTILATALILVIPALAMAEMKMQNSNPNAAEAPLHVMQNSNPNPGQAPEHVMKNNNPKKWVSTNALSLEEKHSGKDAKSK
jgi:hypothetical protein